MAAPLKTDVVNRIRLLLEAGMIETRDIREALLKQTPPIRVGHNSINLHKRAWLAEQRDDHEGRKENDPGFLTSSPPETEPHPDEHVTFEEKGDDGRLSCVTREEVRGEDDLVRVCKIDLTRWSIKKMRVKAYQAAMKLETKEVRDSGGRRVIAHRPHTVQLFSISADLERVLPRPYLDATDALFARIEAAAPEYPEPPGTIQDDPFLAQIGLFDVHLAKLCWRAETGQDYDLRIAERVFRNAGDDLLRWADRHPIGKFVLPLGNDLFHIDSLRNSTTAGTVVDTDGRYAKMIEVGESSVIRLIERLHGIAPVDVVYVPGNHDRLASYHLCRAVSAWFRNAPGISVDLSPAVRKYRRYDSCLFGWQHGEHVSDAQVPTLPGLMAVEAPSDWGATTCREWILGHKHTSRRFVSKGSDERQGVQMRWFSALSATDGWHHESHYVKNRQAAEVYLYDTGSEMGYAGHYVAAARSH